MPDYIREITKLTKNVTLDRGLTKIVTLAILLIFTFIGFGCGDSLVVEGELDYVEFKENQGCGVGRTIIHFKDGRITTLPYMRSIPVRKGKRMKIWKTHRNKIIIKEIPKDGG